MVVILGLAILGFKMVFIKPTETFLKKEFWQGYDTDEFSIFLNFEDSTKHYYYPLIGDTFYLEKKPFGKIVSFNKIKNVLKVKNLKNRKTYYYGKYSE